MQGVNLVKHQVSKRSKMFNAVNVTVMVLFACSILYPFLNMIAISFSMPSHVALGEITLFPKDARLNAYQALLHSNDVIRSYGNTILYCALTVVMTLLISSMAAYTLSVHTFSFKKLFVILFVIPMFVSGGLIPMFLVIKWLNLYNTFWAFVLPACFSAWYIILLRTMMETLPDGLRESAHIDGAGEFRIYAQIVMPLIKPMLATVGLFSMVGMWNSFFAPLIFLQDPKLYPLQIILRRLLTGGEGGNAVINAGGAMAEEFKEAGFLETLKNAAMVITIGPIVLIYPFVQKYFIQGMLVGSVKG